MQELLSSYSKHLSLRGLSQATLRTRRDSLLKFIRWSETQGKIRAQDVTLEDLHAFLEHLKASGNTPQSQETRMVSLRLFFNYLEKTQEILCNPAENLEPFLLAKRLPKNILSEQEMETLLKVPDLSQPIGIRDRAFMELLYSTALRRTECRDLKVYDCDLRSGHVRVNQGKGNKDRVVPLGKTACRYLKLYLEQVRSQQQKSLDQHALFLTPLGTPLHGDSMNLRVKTYAKQAGLAKPVTLHSFRRSAVTHMLKNGASLLTLQRILGHASFETLHKYLAVTITDVKAMHKKKHPRERGMKNEK